MTKTELIKIIDECDEELKTCSPMPIIITKIRSKKNTAVNQLIDIIRGEICD